MSASPSHDLQRAIYQLLAADPALLGEGAVIYDHPPGDASLPLILLGADRVRDASDKTMRGWLHDLGIEVFTAYQGHGQAKRLLAMIEAALDGAVLGLNGAGVLWLRFQAAETFMGADDPGMRGRMRLQARTVAFD